MDGIICKALESLSSKEKKYIYIYIYVKHVTSIVLLKYILIELGRIVELAVPLVNLKAFYIRGSFDSHEIQVSLSVTRNRQRKYDANNHSAYMYVLQGTAS